MDNARQHKTIQHEIIQEKQHKTIQYTIITPKISQYKAIQHNSIQDDTIQYKNKTKSEDIRQVTTRLCNTIQDDIRQDKKQYTIDHKTK